MNTRKNQIQALDKAKKKMLNKGLNIGIGYKFKRKGGDNGCVKVVAYDNNEVIFNDDSGFTHILPLSKFTSDNFER